ncbi:hypothetical protein [Phaeobacter sp. C3_T13_0]|uniref:hypothetical protein n=1 Tax=Phaeobacter cretensis TaxID=3342641 RepID=UPI0039BCEC17
MSAAVMMLITVVGHVAYSVPIWGLLLIYSGLGGALGLVLTLVLMVKDGGFSRKTPPQNS